MAAWLKWLVIAVVLGVAETAMLTAAQQRRPEPRALGAPWRIASA
jgi:hypothetical protein